MCEEKERQKKKKKKRDIRTRRTQRTKRIITMISRSRRGFVEGPLRIATSCVTTKCTVQSRKGPN
ncbi:hypothetical protein PVIIG_03329 [Plasmodium vivax India VII]|uniref:Uncharacterized protein n=1 Tax=Plasmodium vivax India VII TaxID=1077284 RepID=A0A0J9SER3_PLAVI|nr:hypothetical protein PVIIG_03329 [Plasmodium vivax India VII]